MYTREFTPKFITKLASNEIFVFGSNIRGIHAGGAARIALQCFGAIMGQGVGLQGQSYAIPTMEGGVDYIKKYVDDFINFAKNNPQFKFLVTPIGCGIAGFKPSEIAKLFKNALEIPNIILPELFVKELAYSLTAKESWEERKVRMINIFRDTLSIISSDIEVNESCENSMKNTKFYPYQNDLMIEKPTNKKMEISVTNNKTMQAAAKIFAKNPNKKIAVLNFASATNPGGGVKTGSSAQEESLCRVSTLYKSLDQQFLWDKYYNYNRIEQNNLYTDACIYTPLVLVIKSDDDQSELLSIDKRFNVDVITCAAPNFRNIPQSSDDNLYKIHLNRGRKILNVALDNGVECIVLGAFGCGAFKNNPNVVAKAYKQLMNEYNGAFDLVEFAIFYVGSESKNFDAFNKVM